MGRADSDKRMETVHLSEEPTNTYEEITVQLRPSIQWHETRRCKIAGIVFCVVASASIFIVIVVELINAFNNNPYL
jgi:hypothetical protein